MHECVDPVCIACASSHYPVRMGNRSRPHFHIQMFSHIPLDVMHTIADFAVMSYLCSTNKAINRFLRNRYIRAIGKGQGTIAYILNAMKHACFLYVHNASPTWLHEFVQKLGMQITIPQIRSLSIGLDTMHRHNDNRIETSIKGLLHSQKPTHLALYLRGCLGSRSQNIINGLKMLDTVVSINLFIPDYSYVGGVFSSMTHLEHLRHLTIAMRSKVLDCKKNISDLRICMRGLSSFTFWIFGTFSLTELDTESLNNLFRCIADGGSGTLCKLDVLFADCVPHDLCALPGLLYGLDVLSETLSHCYIQSDSNTQSWPLVMQVCKKISDMCVMRIPSTFVIDCIRRNRMCTINPCTGRWAMLCAHAIQIDQMFYPSIALSKLTVSVHSGRNLSTEIASVKCILMNSPTLHTLTLHVNTKRHDPNATWMHVYNAFIGAIDGIIHFTIVPSSIGKIQTDSIFLYAIMLLLCSSPRMHAIIDIGALSCRVFHGCSMRQHATYDVYKQKVDVLCGSPRRKFDILWSLRSISVVLFGIDTLHICKSGPAADVTRHDNSTTMGYTT